MEEAVLKSVSAFRIMGATWCAPSSKLDNVDNTVIGEF